jgi:hypothetical protein
MLDYTSERRAMFLSRFLFCFVLLFIISLPFPYNIIPDIGNWISLIWRPLVRFAAEGIFGISKPYTLEIVSDSTGMYLQTILLFLIATILAGVWHILKKEKEPRLNYFIEILCAYYLSLQFFKYGFDKLFKYQFYLPEPNTLYTKLGDLSKDILYWSSIGSSHSYSVFLGLTEIIPAFLFLFRKTRLIGAIIALFVMINVTMINFSFDISVKLYSGFLLMLCIIIAGPGVFKIYSGLKNRDWKAEADLTAVKPQLYFTLKTGLILLILTESLWGYVASGVYNDDSALRPYLHGAWKVTRHIQNNDTLNCSHSDYIQNIFIHRKGYLIIQNRNGEMKDYKLSVIRNYLQLTDYDSTTIRFQYSENNNTLLLRNEYTEIQTEKTDLQKLPLLDKDFHWTIDFY